VPQLIKLAVVLESADVEHAVNKPRCPAWDESTVCQVCHEQVRVMRRNKACAAPRHVFLAVTLTTFWMLALCAPIRAFDLGAEITASLPRVQAAYRFLHENPELGKKETKAYAYLIEQLRQIGYSAFIESQKAPTAVITVLDSGAPGPVIALRAEMDARPIEGEEPASHSPRSSLPGYMHNCGHDAHAAMLLGAAEVLYRNRSSLKGKIVFLFQPAEETPGGADDIVAERILPQLGVQAIYAQHSAPGLPVGSIAAAPGTALAGSNYFTLTLKGAGSHAAAPYQGADVPIAAAKIAQELVTFPARHIDISNRPVVISITKLQALGASNVIPTTAEIAGTIRAFEDITADTAAHPALFTQLQQSIGALATAYGLEATWNRLHVASPPTINDPLLYAKVSPKLRAAWQDRFDTSPGRGMYSEDFAYYTRDLPALYFALGIAGEGLGKAGVHTKEFTIHPKAFEHGLRLLLQLAEIGTGEGM
jgi:amidohydrolase